MRGTSLLRECHLSRRTNSLKMLSITFGMTSSCLKSVRIKSSGGVFTAKKPLTFSRLATIDPPGDTMARTTLPKRKVQLNELNKLRDQAYENSLIYKEKTKRLHDSKIKDCVFNVVFPYGTVELSQTDGPNFKVNGHRLKHYIGEDIPKMVVPDLQTFSKDQ
nr:hypothetical protein [Tanacetum cinerariifolium]